MAKNKVVRPWRADVRLIVPEHDKSGRTIPDTVAWEFSGERTVFAASASMAQKALRRSLEHEFDLPRDSFTLVTPHLRALDEDGNPIPIEDE